MIKAFLYRYKWTRHLIFKLKYIRKFKKKRIKGIDNKIKDLGYTFNITWDIIGDNNYISMNKGTSLSNLNVYIRGNNNKIEIGNQSVFHSGSLWIEGSNCSINIGQSVTVNDAQFAAVEDNMNITVGDYCLFSQSIELRTSDSHSIIDLDTNKRINKGKNINIGKHVWIGARVVILKGSNIGSDSIIGTNSVVTGQHPSNSIIAGIPAKVIKSNVTWDINQI